MGILINAYFSGVNERIYLQQESIYMFKDPSYLLADKIFSSKVKVIRKGQGQLQILPLFMTFKIVVRD